MNLFVCSYSEPEALGITPQIETPLGLVLLDATIVERHLSATPPQWAWRLPDSARLLRWEDDAFAAELLLCRPRFVLPAGMRVDECQAAMWRLRSHGDLPSLLFSAHWEEGRRWQEAGPEPGEGLDAWAWSAGGLEVSIGTEDADFLQGRALRGDHLPQRWATHFGDDYYFQNTGALNENGLTIRTPLMPAGELCQFHFVVAWARAPTDQLGTWFAVERSPDDILSAAQCE